MLGFAIAMIILATLPLILLRPHVGILAWTWLGLMNPHRMSWGGVVESGHFSLIIGSATLLAWFLSREPKRVPLNAITVLLALFALSLTLSTIAALAPEAAFEGWSRSIKIMLMAFVTMALTERRTRLHALIWITVLSLGFFGVTNGMKTILSGGQSIVWGPSRSFIADNNQLALAMLMTLPLMRYLQLQTDNRLFRWGLGAAMVLTFFSVIGSHSRGAFLGLLIVTVTLIMKSRYRLRIGALILGLAVIGAFFVPQSWVERMETIRHYEQDESAMSRLRAWDFNYQIARERPILGGGINAHENRELFMRLVPDAKKVRNAHSVYFQALGSQGFLGLFLFLALAVAVWKSLSRVRKTTKNDKRNSWAYDLASMVQVSMLGYFSAGAFVNLTYFDLYYLVVALAVALPRAIALERPASEPTRPETKSAELVDFAAPKPRLHPLRG